MLADLLERTRDQVEEELVRRAGEIESTDLPVAGRRKRLTEFLQDLIDTLRRGGIAPAVEPVKGPASVSPELELRERELVRRYLIEQIEQGRLAATPSETVIVAEWVAAVNGRRLDEQGRGLRALLDTIPESAALISPEGRLLYCNLRAAEHLRAALGLPKDELVGKTAAEIGIPAHLMIGRPIDEITELARKRERFEMNAWGREKEGQFEAIYRPNGTLGAISVIIRDIHNRRLADTRLDLLTKLSAVAGILDFDEVARALVAVPIPQFADWCALNVVRHGHIRRTYLANRIRGREAAAEQRDLLLRHAERVEAEIAAQRVRLEYLREKAALWDARDRGDATAEAETIERLIGVVEVLR